MVINFPNLWKYLPTDLISLVKPKWNKHKEKYTEAHHTQSEEQNGHRRHHESSQKKQYIVYNIQQ